MPIAIPSDQNVPIAESSLTPCRDESHSIPKEERIENIIAERIGFHPKKKLIPKPPIDACVIPPVINTKRRTTTYVPTIPQAMLASKLPSKAFWKKG